MNTFHLTESPMFWCAINNLLLCGMLIWLSIRLHRLEKRLTQPAKPASYDASRSNDYPLDYEEEVERIRFETRQYEADAAKNPPPETELDPNPVTRTTVPDEALIKMKGQ